MCTNCLSKPTHVTMLHIKLSSTCLGSSVAAATGWAETHTCSATPLLHTYLTCIRWMGIICMPTSLTLKLLHSGCFVSYTSDVFCFFYACWMHPFSTLQTFTMTETKTDKGNRAWGIHILMYVQIVIALGVQKIPTECPWIISNLPIELHI